MDLTSLTLGVTASDGTNTSSESQVTVNITRVNDNAPTIDTAAGSTVTEESVSTSTVVATFTASDLDDQDNVTYEITSGNDNNYFAIDSDGKVTLTDAGVAAINSDAGVDLTSLTLGVTASDGTNTSSESQVTVNITRVNDNAPTIDTAAGSTVTEESVSTSTVVATFTASDLDDQDNVTYEITSGNDNNYFAIDSDGKVTLTDAAWRRSTAMRRGPNQPDAGRDGERWHEYVFRKPSDGEHHTSERQCTDDRHGGRQHRDRRVGEHLNSGSDVHGERPG
ncbi:cadherin-like domain-containing protein [Vibrio vulnificus]|uniref:cadherin-like domain-containing protein n=1 Tax=Vibrio vulnificus TaxID=672 RepID=UPI000735A471|nr:cadherin-like domain-containing protein [Vibrio vulnificus]